jgi:hypothetical protein
MNLDELLERDCTIPTMDPAAKATSRDRAVATAREGIARQAKVLRIRRSRRALISVAAAAVAGVAVISQTGGTSGPHPRTTVAQNNPSQAPPVQVEFKTVAQVLNAASTASSHGADPASAPYWRIETKYNCDLQMVSAPVPKDGLCTHTEWLGIGRPGVVTDTAFPDRPAIPAETITLNGQTMSVATFNSRTWTEAQLASLVADGGSSGEPGRAPAEYYVFKNTGDLLTNSPLSPTIRKELWQHLERVPGVRLDGRAKDRLGREGWKVSLAVPGYGRNSYLVDTTTGGILEESGSRPDGSTYTATVVYEGPAQSAPTPTDQSTRRLTPAPNSKPKPPVDQGLVDIAPAG